MNKLRLLKTTLVLGAIYFLIGAFVHYFGITLFPFYDGRLHTPYLDSVIAVAAIVLALFLLAIARDPIKNIDTLNVVIVGVLLGSIVSIAIIWRRDFVALGAPAKKLQTIVEGIIGFIYFGILLWLYPRNTTQ